jgi:SAM-dependent methyltransferase
MSLHYTALAEDWHLLFPLRLSMLDRLAQLAGPPPARVLDLGGGTGEAAAALRQRGYDAHCVDVSPRMCALARERHAGLPVIHGDMLEVFDLVRGPLALAYCVGGTLCELADVAQVADVLAQLADLCRPGGTLVFQVPNFDHLAAQAERLRAEAAEVAPSDVTYGDLVDSEHGEGSPQLGSVSADELRLYLPPVRVSRADGGELRLERQYVFTADGQMLEDFSFSAPEGSSSGSLPLLPLPRKVLEQCLPSDAAQVEWLGGWDGTPWSSAAGLTIGVVRFT